jgi:hypothetical protein
METAGRDIPAGTKVIPICDREGDRYELFCKAIKNSRFFLIRVIQNRLTVENEKIRKTAVKGQVEVHILRDSQRKVKAREAVLMVRFAQFEIRKPHILNKHKELPQSIRVNIIYVKEEYPPKGLAPIAWFLMTNDEVKSVGQAFEKVG